MYICKFKIYF